MAKRGAGKVRKADFIEAMECLPVTKIPDGPEWTYEIKLDGYRLQAVKCKGKVTLYSRRKNILNESSTTLPRLWTFCPTRRSSTGNSSHSARMERQISICSRFDPCQLHRGYQAGHDGQGPCRFICRSRRERREEAIFGQVLPCVFTVLALDDGVVLYGLDLSTWGAWAAERDLPAGTADNVPVFVGRRVVRFHWRSACHFQIRRTVPMKTSDGL